MATEVIRCWCVCYKRVVAKFHYSMLKRACFDDQYVMQSAIEFRAIATKGLRVNFG